MSEHEVEVGAVEPVPDERVEQVTALLILKLEQGDTYVETAAAVVGMLDTLAEHDEDDVDEDEVDDAERYRVRLIRGVFAALWAGAALLVVAFVLGVVSVWTDARSGDYADTAVLTLLAAAFVLVAAAGVMRAIPTGDLS